jgi:hypothetical protein
MLPLYYRELPLVTPTPADAILVDDDAFAGFTYEGEVSMKGGKDDAMEVEWEEDDL